MKWIATVLVGIIGVACMVHVSRGAEEGSRPPGVPAVDWIRIDDRLGFVIVRGTNDATGAGDTRTLRAGPEHVAADLMPPLKGYFVIQTPTGWRTAVITEPVSFRQ